MVGILPQVALFCVFSLEYYVTAVLFHVLTLSYTCIRFSESARRGRKAHVGHNRASTELALSFLSFYLWRQRLEGSI